MGPLHAEDAENAQECGQNCLGLSRVIMRSTVWLQFRVKG